MSADGCLVKRNFQSRNCASSQKLGHLSPKPMDLMFCERSFMANSSKYHRPFVVVEVSSMLNQFILQVNVCLNRNDSLQVISCRAFSIGIIDPAEVADFCAKSLAVIGICLPFLCHQLVEPSLTCRSNGVCVSLRSPFAWLTRDRTNKALRLHSRE